MNKFRRSTLRWLNSSLKASISLILFATAAIVHAQSSTEGGGGSDAERRMMRARAQAVTGNLTVAAFELDAIRTSTSDDAVRDVACVMLMRIYLEQAAYGRAEKLLNEAFEGRANRSERAARLYFALAGQVINGARAHLERYRAFGLNFADKTLPPEASNDIDNLRRLIEAVADQARRVQSEDAKSMDAVALLEDAAKVRATLARDEAERTKWEAETASARQRLVASETRIASISPFSLRRAHAPANTARTASASTARNHSSPTPTSQTLTSNRSAPPSSSTSTPNRSTPPASAATAQPPAVRERQTGGTAEDTSKPVEVGSLIDRVTQRVTPAYPPTARAARTTGVVTVYLVVNERGAVESVQRTSGPELLRRAAEDAARRWKFRPMIVEGQPVRVSGYVSFNFAL